MFGGKILSVLLRNAKESKFMYCLNSTGLLNKNSIGIDDSTGTSIVISLNYRPPKGTQY